MDSCCEGKARALEQLRVSQARMLKLVLAINAAMFFVEVAAAWLSNSTALLGDSLDMFGDAVLYGVSLYVIDRGTTWRARAALLKGSVMVLLGLGVLVEAAVQARNGVIPHAPTMGAIGLLALVANTGCLLLLVRHRRDDINMRSAWICSRNDIIANLAVLGAALTVRVLGSFWPDVLVGTAVAALFILSAVGVARESLLQLRTEPATEGSTA